jgi:hypothetical protein
MTTRALHIRCATHGAITHLTRTRAKSMKVWHIKLWRNYNNTPRCVYTGASMLRIGDIGEVMSTL